MFWKSGDMEIATDGDDVIMRSAKHPETEVKCTRQEWDEFIAGAAAGEFNLES